MRAWLLDDFTGIDRLRLAEVPDPVPGPGEVLLEVHYAGLNPADRYLAERLYPANPPLPHILGRDALGVVAGVGRGVSGHPQGSKRVVLRSEIGVSRPGTFAQFTTIPAENLVEVPAGWSDPEAAGATLVYLTAYQALTMWGALPPSIVLVTGASGGVGVAACQLAKALGHRVLALSRSSDKSQKLLILGAEACFNPADPHWRKQVKEHLGSQRVDLAIDNIGGPLLPQVIDTLGDHGKVSLVGRLAGPVPQFNTASLFFRRLRLGGVAVGAYTNAESRAAWAHITQLLAQAGFKPIVDRVLPFPQLKEAFARLAQGPMGKVLLQVRP